MIEEPAGLTELDEVVLTYLEAVEAGAAPDRAVLLARYPHLSAELTAYFVDHDRFDSFVSPFRLGPSLPAGPLPRSFGNYDLLEEIARGGMGVVFRARQRGLSRDVAIKVIRSGALASPEDRQRFRREAEAAARLDHPNIVPIYEVGEHDGLPYFSMKRIEGGSLADRGQQPPAVAARLVAPVARAVHYAHERGTLHRDLKPANVLLDGAGVAYVTDFGLARSLDPASPELTPSGVAVGTPCFMAPEQVAGPRKAIGPAVDVYGLGAILYELLTGRPPFRGETPLDTLTQVRERLPEPPRRFCPDLPPDLEAVCLRCLEKEPARRYATAAELADDLERFLAGEPTQARPAGPLKRAWLCLRRRPRAGAAVVLLTAALGALAVAHGQWQRDQERLARLRQERDEARAAHLADVARRQTDLGRNERDRRRPAKAAAAFTAARDALEELAALRPNEPRAKQDLATAYFDRANVLAALGRRDEEQQDYETSRDLLDALTKEFPEEPAYHSDLGRTLNNLGLTYAQRGHIPEGRVALRRAVEEQRAALAKSPQEAHYRRCLSSHYGALAEVERKKGTPAASAEALRARRPLCAGDGKELFRLACEFAQTAAFVARGKKEPTPAEVDERDAYRNEALAVLKEAVAAGFRDADALRKSADLAPLRSHPEFIRLLSEMTR